MVPTDTKANGLKVDLYLGSRLVKGAFMSTVISDKLTNKVHSLQELSDQYGLQLTCNIPSGLAIETDPELTLLVIEGLINTAFKFGCEGDEIEVTGCKDGHVTIDVLLTCADTAPRNEALEGNLAIVDPLLRMLKAELEITFPTDKSILFTIQLPKAVST